MATAKQAAKRTPKTPAQTPDPRAPAAKVGNVAAAASELRSRTGKLIRMRAIGTGFYGISGKAADIRKPDDEFVFAVKDLVPFKGGDWGDGTPKRAIRIEGVDYTLPSWCEDGRPNAESRGGEPAEIEEDDDTDEFEEVIDDPTPPATDPAVPSGSPAPERPQDQTVI